MHDNRYHSAACPHNKHRAPISELSFETLMETYLCIQELFAQHQPGPWSHPLKLQPHACHVTTCPMVQHRQIYVCLASGNFHHCGEMACCYGSKDSGMLSCPVTDLSFSPENSAHYTWGYADGVRSQDQMLMTRGLKATGAAAGTPTLRQMVHKKRTRQSGAEAAPSSMHDHMAAKDASDQYVVDQQNTRRVARWVGSTPVHLVAGTEEHGSIREPITNPTRHEELAREIDTLYHQLLENWTPPSTYTYDVHVFVMLYLMANNGATYGSHTYVPSYPDVRKALPFTLSQLLPRARLSNTAYNRHVQMFHSAMAKRLKGRRADCLYVD